MPSRNKRYGHRLRPPTMTEKSRRRKLSFAFSPPLLLRLFHFFFNFFLWQTLFVWVRFSHVLLDWKFYSILRRAAIAAANDRLCIWLVDVVRMYAPWCVGYANFPLVVMTFRVLFVLLFIYLLAVAGGNAYGRNWKKRKKFPSPTRIRCGNGISNNRQQYYNI